MFAKSETFYDAIYSFKDYAGEATAITRIVSETNPGAKTLLDVACGTGLHVQRLRDTYDVAGLDVDPEMVRIASEKNPGVDIRVADMIDFDFGRTFDVVTCLFSSIGYVRTRENLGRATATMARHLAAGGVLLIEPWIFPGDFVSGFADTLIADYDGGKIVRAAFSERVDDTSVLDLHYLVRDSAGEVTHFSEQHVLGLFEREDYERAVEESRLDLVRFDPDGLMGRGLVIATRPS